MAAASPQPFEGTWQVVHERPLAPRLRKNGVRKSIDPAVDTDWTMPVSSGKLSSGATSSPRAPRGRAKPPGRRAPRETDAGGPRHHAPHRRNAVPLKRSRTYLRRALRNAVPDLGVAASM